MSPVKKFNSGKRLYGFSTGYEFAPRADMKKWMLVAIFLTNLCSFVAIAQNNWSYEQRVVISYALEGVGKSSDEKMALYRQIKTFLTEHYQMPKKVVEVRNFSEFLNMYKGDWPNTESLENDLLYIAKRHARGPITYVSQSARIQRKIDQFLIEQQQKLIAMLIASDKTNAKQNNLFTAGEVESLSNFAEFLFKRIDQFFLQKMSLLNTVGDRISINTTGEEQNYTTVLLKVLIGEYFKNLSLKSKKQIFSSMIAETMNPEELSELKTFEIMIQNSGPFLQKLLQILARKKEISEEIRDVLKNLENSVKAVSPMQVQEILDAEKENFQFVRFEMKPLGVGTMAEVHRAKIVVDGSETDVVVRFIKPGIEERVEEDYLILQKIAPVIDAEIEKNNFKVPKVARLIDEIMKAIHAELNMQQTVELQMKAKPAYDRNVIVDGDGIKTELHIRVPKIFSAKDRSKLMVQEMVFGSKLDKELFMYQELAPGLKRAVVEEIAKFWLRETIFESGIYHADLHPGNFLVRFAEPNIGLSILDFGMGGVLSKSMQDQLLIMSVATELHQADLMANALIQIAKLNKMSVFDEQLLRSVIKLKMQNIINRAGPEMAFNDWVIFLNDQGFKLPYDLVNMSRGLTVISEMLEQSGSKESVVTLAKSIALKYPGRFYEILIKSKLMTITDLFKQGYEALRFIKDTPKMCRDVLL